MSVASLAKTKARYVMGIDASTTSIAFTIFFNRRPIKWGKITLTGSSIYDKIDDARAKIAALGNEFNVDYVAIESAILVNSPSVAIKMAMVLGAILAELQRQGTQVIDFSPMTWQAHIGNKRLTTEEKAALRLEFPDKKPSWYQKHGRDIRKQRTIDYFNKRFKMNLDDDDVADSCGIAFYAYWTLTKRT